MVDICCVTARNTQGLVDTETLKPGISVSPHESSPMFDAY